MNKWIGRTEHDVLLKMGTPTKTSSDGAGGKIIRYSHSSSTTTYNKYLFYNPDVANAYNVYSNTNTRTKYVEFYIDSNQTIYLWRTNYSDLKKKTRVAPAYNPNYSNYSNSPDSR